MIKKNKAQPLQRELSISTRTFFEQLWRQKKKADLVLTVSTIQERNKKNAKYDVGDYFTTEETYF